MKRVAVTLYWVIPVLFCIALYWRGLVIWFVQDDFGWLGLRKLVTDGPSLLWAMFTPLAQGTVRPWSERGFFLLFSSLFGVHPLPFRAFVFVNQFMNIVLIVFLTRKVTHSATAAFIHLCCGWPIRRLSFPWRGPPPITKSNARHSFY